MAKDIELIYSQQNNGFIKGRAYANPRFFSTPRSGVSKVLIVGSWPNIEEAYAAIGVPVERIGAGDSTTVVPEVVFTPPPVVAEDPAGADIPENWRDLPWSKPGDDGLTIRGVAKAVSPTPVLNKDQAVVAIEAELARRAGAVDPLDIPQDAALGLTLREIHADLTRMGVDWGKADDADPANLLRMRDEARAMNEAG